MYSTPSFPLSQQKALTHPKDCSEKGKKNLSSVIAFTCVSICVCVWEKHEERWRRGDIRLLHPTGQQMPDKTLEQWCWLSSPYFCSEKKTPKKQLTSCLSFCISKIHTTVSTTCKRDILVSTADRNYLLSFSSPRFIILCCQLSWYHMWQMCHIWNTAPKINQ